eukprot:CAMPEP_0197312822 /NCGR_PEP_ID=MMETSP0891-20130614/23494_1 /TAXON_ID=44058 ORGANISM="Aureoumbra lagunensis, Strain CCMP1510" /NCGR_SAMPLE_ID=MMETSP0891 /ASSEMBLY_ACC=CAM_ASM_000534 /LENGTH=1129 /DNA_ID=CAMNT_0042800277 /DNA_START=198 /DNA_END=3587 /DNA_ORIENTATION=+
MGDQAYGDCVNPELECQELVDAYADLDAIPEFAEFKQEQPLLATWDDHDYCDDNTGAECPYKYKNKDLFMDFYEIREDHPMRSRDGVYSAYEFGPDGQKLQIILLDTRFFKTLNTDGVGGTMLGDEQWAWLESEFAKDADLRILVSSIQYLGNEFESWYQMDCEQKRLLEILPDNVVIISGDRHKGAFYQLDAWNGAEYLGWNSWFDGYLTPPLTLSEGQNAPLFEVTASGLNSALGGGDNEEPGPHRVPGSPLVLVDHYGLLEIDWTTRTVTASLADSYTNEVFDGMTISYEFPESRRKNQRRNLRFGFHTTDDNDDIGCAASYSCTPWSGGTVTDLVSSLTGSVWFKAGTFPADPLLRETDANISVTAMLSGGEYTPLAQDSYWQVPTNWVGLAWVSGPMDGQGTKLLGVVNYDGDQQNMIRIFQNNEISEGADTAMTYMVSNVESKGSLYPIGTGNPFPNADEMFSVHGAPLRYYDISIESSGGQTSYEVLRSGIAIKRIYVSDGVDTVTLMSSREAFTEATGGLEGPSRFCGANFHIPHQFSTEEEGAGFEDEMYIGGHEESAWPAIFVLDTILGNIYFLPMPYAVETAAPIYSGSSDYIAMAVNVYPGVDGQNIHLWVGKKVPDSDDFLERNGLHPAHGQRYVLTIDSGEQDWEELDAEVNYAATFFPVDSATNIFGTSQNKNEWASVNKLSPTMWAQALTGDDDIAIFSADVGGSDLDCESIGGSPLPCSISATAKHLGVKTLIDEDFGDPDSIYWSPRGFLMIAEDGSQGRLLRLDLDEEGKTTGSMRTLTRVADAGLVTDLNSVPPMTIPDSGASQAEFTGIIPHGFYHSVGPASTAAEILAAEMEVEREQYLVNLQLHAHVEGIIDEYKLGESSQLLRIDVDPDSEATSEKMYVWDQVGFYNGRRASYCAENDCSDMRGEFVKGEVVLHSDFAALEVWRGLEEGTYLNDLDAIIAESLSFNNIEEALLYVWDQVGFYNGRRASYCAENDCSALRGDYVPGEIVLVSDFAALEIFRGLEEGTYLNDLDAIIAESLSFNNMEPIIAYVWDQVGFYNGRRASYCAENDCSEMRGEFVEGEVVLVSDFAALEIWRGLDSGTYTNDLDAIIAESLSFDNMEPAGF